MAEHYWFKARKFGYGWTPSTWQGWLVLLAYIVLLVYSFFQSDSHSHSVSDTLLNYLPKFLTFTAILIVITYLKGETTTWQKQERTIHKEEKN